MSSPLKPRAAEVKYPDKPAETQDIPTPPGVPRRAERLSSSSVNPTVQFSDPGDYFIGRYLRRRTLTVDDEPRTIYDLDADGTVVSVWGSTILDKRMADVSVGLMVSIMYVGEVGEAKRGRSRAKDFVVDYWRVEAERKEQPDTR